MGKYYRPIVLFGVGPILLSSWFEESEKDFSFLERIFSYFSLMLSVQSCVLSEVIGIAWAVHHVGACVAHTEQLSTISSSSLSSSSPSCRFDVCIEHRLQRWDLFGNQEESSNNRRRQQETAADDNNDEAFLKLRSHS